MKRLPDSDEENSDNADMFYFVVGGTVLIGALAIILSVVMSVDLASLFVITPNDIAIGIIATVPLGVFLWWFDGSTIKPISELRSSQIEFLNQIGFDLTPMRIVALSLAAGICEELLFRGVLQTWLTSMTTVVGAIVVSNIIFGLLHYRTWVYALIAGLVGVYLGCIFVMTGGLLAPMITHGLYDALAFSNARRAISEHRAGISA